MNLEKQSTNLQMILREVNRVGEGQKNVPKLRFKGYEDAWEQRKLGEEVQIVMGQSPKGENYTDNPEDYILVQGNADMKDGKVFPRVWTTQVTKQAHKGDIILSVRAPVGDIGKTDYDVVIGRGVAAVKGNEFFYQLLGKFKLDGYWTKSSTGSTFDSINSNEIKNAKVTIPDINEQLFIGDYFQGIDNLITLHQRKYDALKAMKKTLLSKMFPKNGEDIPEIRFKGFTNAWEQRKLGEEVQIVMGQSPKGENYTDNPEDYILVQGNADMKDGKVFPRVWTTQVTKQAHKGDIILSVRAPVGDIGKTDYDVVIGRGVAAVKGNEFFYQLLGKFKLDGYWTKSSTGSTFDSINSNEIKNAKVTIPDINEQLFIGDYFQGIDNLITLHQRKLDELKNMKKTLLQQMFV